MENSSKALLIVAAVLIAILLIAISIKMFNSQQDVQKQATDVGMSISGKIEDTTEDLSSSFEINRQIISGEVSSTPNDEIQESETTTTNWHIKNVDDLKNFANLVNGGNDFNGITVYLDENLDLKKEIWTPIGNKEKLFSGTFDGQNHYIKGVNVNVENYAGLFGVAKEIKNLTVKDSTICSTNYYAGGIASVVKYIDNCTSENNKVSGIVYVGGITGAAPFENSSITNCKNTSEVKTTLSAEDITDNIKKYGSYTGGIVGCIYIGTTINGCVNEGNITSNRSRIGGIVGSTNSQKISITNCINKGNITLQSYDGTEQYAAGIVGLIATDGQDPSSNISEENRNRVSYCYNEGTIKGKGSVGGIVGCIAQYLSLVERCYNYGDISGDFSIAGIAGTMGRSSQIINCYNAGNIDGNTNIAGILAISYGSANPNGGIINCYNLGKINNVDNNNIITGSDSKYEAEILGKNGNNITLINCITNREEIKTNFINNTKNNVWEIKSGINNGYPVIVGMN